jgi:hypothetical protein
MDLDIEPGTEHTGRWGGVARAKSLLLQSDYLEHRNGNTYLVLSKFCVRASAHARRGVKEKARRFWSRAYLPK